VTQGDVWKPYPSDPRYEVSVNGLVRMVGAKPRKPSVTPTGYHVIVYRLPSGKPVGRYVHRMVMETFVGQCPNGMSVSHINGDNSDNRLDNLVYETHKNNVSRKVSHGTYTAGANHHTAKLSASDVTAIRLSSQSCAKLAKILGVSASTISRVRRGVHYAS
jgi:hypothetical protein